ncbi:beta-lactamase-like protein [Paraphysoderma sedebokerense]|nr:beta-lactamase-like protein [Paraphysoderma sedebokerense]
MKWFLQVLSTDSVDVSPSILVHFDSQRYLFNCGEGTQRFCVENAARLTKLKNVFLTRLDWERVGGLPGMLLTISDAGTNNINVYGPENTTHFVATTRHFIQRDTTNLSTHDFPVDGSVFQDENLRITPIMLHPSDSKERPLNVGPSPSSAGQKRKAQGDQSRTANNPSTDKKRIVMEMFGSSLLNGSAGGTGSNSAQGRKKGATPCPGVGDLSNDKSRQNQHQVRNPMSIPPGISSKTAICYICKGPEVPGKFNPKAAMALGVKRGPDFGRLTKGISITTESGTVVHPQQVMAATKPSSDFIILDVPSPSYIPSLLSASQIKPYLDSATSEFNQLKCVIHLGDSSVLESTNYKKFLNEFNKNVYHFVLSRDYAKDGAAFQSSAVAQAKLKLLDESVFPGLIVEHSSLTPVHLRSSTNETSVGYQSRKIVPKPLQTLIFEPKLVLTENTYNHIDLSSREFKTATNEMEEFWTEVKEVTTVLEKKGIISAPLYNARNDDGIISSNTQLDKESKSTSERLIVSTLGTGSAIPSKYRNVTSNIITSAHGSIILDCGEGTFGQLYRLLGPSSLTHPSTYLPSSLSTRIPKDHPKSYPLIRQKYPNISAFLDDLKVIFISHMHADHHLGLIKILNMFNEHHATQASITENKEVKSVFGDSPRFLPSNPKTFPSSFNSTSPISVNKTSHQPVLYIIGPPRLLHFLSEYASTYSYSVPLLKYVRFIPSPHLVPTAFSKLLENSHINREMESVMPGVVTNVDQTIREMRNAAGLTTVECCDVIHCPFSYAIRLEGRGDDIFIESDSADVDMPGADGSNSNNGTWSLVFSGDTRPCRDLVALSEGVDLLIHEATLEDGMEQEANHKRHCTTGQAIEIWERSKAKNLLLTHFSQRYPKIPQIKASRRFNIDPKTTEEELKKNDGAAEGVIEISMDSDSDDDKQPVELKMDVEMEAMNDEPTELMDEQVSTTLTPKPIAIAFDFLTFGLDSQFQRLPYYYKALSVVCRDQAVEEEMKAQTMSIDQD